MFSGYLFSTLIHITREDIAVIQDDNLNIRGHQRGKAITALLWFRMNWMLLWCSLQGFFWSVYPQVWTDVLWFYAFVFWFQILSYGLRCQIAKERLISNNSKSVDSLFDSVEKFWFKKCIVKDYFVIIFLFSLIHSK